MLTQHPDIAAATAAFHGNGDDDAIAAYFVTKPGRTPGVDGLRAWLASRLPGYMIPATFVRLDAMPLTPNGKIDVRGLPRQQPAHEEPSLEAWDITEFRLLKLWEQLFGSHLFTAGNGSTTRSFFDVGGDSLLAVRFLTRVERTFGVRVTLRELFEAISGVQGAGAIDALFSDYVPDNSITVEGHAHLSAGDDSEASGSHVVSRGYFETAAVPLLRGRLFASTDGPQSQAVAIINQSMAKRLWVGEDPIGRRFRYGVPGETPSMWRTVVGVVGDTLPDGPESRVFPQFFLPQTQVPWTASMDMVIRVKDNRVPLASSIRAAILSVSSEIPRVRSDDRRFRAGSVG